MKQKTRSKKGDNRVGFRLPDPVMSWAKKVASRRGESVHDFIKSLALDRYADREDKRIPAGCA